MVSNYFFDSPYNKKCKEVDMKTETLPEIMRDLHGLSFYLGKYDEIKKQSIVGAVMLDIGVIAGSLENSL